MTCPACSRYASNRLSGHFEAECRACQIREIALGPLFYTSLKAKRITKAYRDHMESLFSNGWEATHLEVKAAYEAHKNPPAQSSLI